MIALAACAANAAQIGRDVEYKHDGTTLQGYLAVPTLRAGDRRPAVLIVHDWNGLGDYEKRRARMVAELGYVALAVDVYGKGVRPATPQASGAEAGKYRGNRPLLRARLQAALEWVAKRRDVDPRRVAVMGYCFGGLAALELARSGAAVVGAVSFHGSLDTPTPADSKKIRGQILVLHGADDPFVPPAQVESFKKEMREGDVRYTFVAYPGAVHSFTEPEAGNDNSKGAAYNAEADRKSWSEMKDFFRRIFR